MAEILLSPIKKPVKRLKIKREMLDTFPKKGQKWNPALSGSGFRYLSTPKPKLCKKAYFEAMKTGQGGFKKHCLL